METFGSAGRAPGGGDLISAYLSGRDAAFQTVDVWVRTEISTRFPALRREAEDVRQIVHQKLLGAFREGRFQSRSSLRTYVGRVTRYTAIDVIRKRYRDWIVEEEGGSRERPRQGPYRRLLQLEQRALLRQIWFLSPALCRQLWRLAYVESLSYTEIARRLSIPPGTVKSRMWSCRRQALARLQGRGAAAPTSWAE